MLGGINPILIFTFTNPKDLDTKAKDQAAGIPDKEKDQESTLGEIAKFGKDFIAPLLSGIPIPIYLSEAVTGIFVSDESIDINADTTVQASASNKSGVLDQKPLESVFRVELVSTRQSLVLASLIALSDIVFTRLVSKTYSISYVNGSTIVLGALLRTFSAKQSPDNTKVDVTIELTKTVKTTGVTPIANAAKSAVRGALP